MRCFSVGVVVVLLPYLAAIWLRLKSRKASSGERIRAARRRTATQVARGCKGAKEDTRHWL
jgi:hypothetical protein